MTQVLRAGSLINPKGSNLCPKAVAFDGSNDFMLRGAGLTGAADGPRGIFSAFVNLTGGDGNAQRIINTTGGEFRVSRLATNLYEIQVADTGFANGMNITTSATFLAGGGWKHILASWDINAAAGARSSNLYINDVSDKVLAADFGVAANIDYTQANWAIGADIAGTNKLQANIAHVYLNITQYLDFSTVANRRKFVSSTGGAVYLGSDGSAPTGTAPAIFLKGPASAFSFNAGSGGNFTVTGSLDDGSSRPPCG